jgi:hypothetical protein
MSNLIGVQTSEFGRSSAVVYLQRHELNLLSNALNEIANGVLDLADDHEFEIRVGAQREGPGRCLHTPAGYWNAWTACRANTDGANLAIGSPSADCPRERVESLTPLGCASPGGTKW